MKNIPKPIKLIIKAILTVLIIPYMIITGALFVLTAFLPEALISKMAVLFAYIGWSICSINLRLSSTLEITSEEFKGSCILISNHIGSLDFAIIHELALKNGMLWFMKYIIKKEAIYIPIFGYIMKKINFLFLKRNFEEDKEIIKDYCKAIKEKKEKVWFVVYPEGTRFTEEKKIKSQEFSKSKNLPEFNHVLFPRGKGMKVIVDNLCHSHIKNIIDVTLYYENEVPSLLYFLLFVTDAKIKLHAEKIDIEEIKDINEFLIERFKEKDKLIGKWKNK